MNKNISEEWLFEISPKKSAFEINFKELWDYKDLLLLFVKRDIVTFYKQTVFCLGIAMFMNSL